MHVRLRTLLIVMAVIPPAIAVLCSGRENVVVPVAIYLVSVVMMKRWLGRMAG